jgi:hypothetical protein
MLFHLKKDREEALLPALKKEGEDAPPPLKMGGPE